jgi:hypothetical protein
LWRKVLLVKLLSVRLRFPLVTAVAVLLILTGCGGTWVDDDRNFQRVFGFDKPNDVQVLHSFYWKSAHWSTEYRYYISLRASSQFASSLTDARLMRPAAPEFAPDSCGSDRPDWFAPKSMTKYEMWVSKENLSYYVFRDKDDGVIYACDEQL